MFGSSPMGRWCRSSTANAENPRYVKSGAEFRSRRHQGPRRLHKPVQRLAHVLWIVGRGEIPCDVVDRRLEDVQLIPQRVEFGPGHDQLPLAEPRFGGALPGLPVPLAARLPAIQPRAAATRPDRESAAAPLAPSTLLYFRHRRKS
jgi:hypothetical protein